MAVKEMIKHDVDRGLSLFRIVLFLFFVGTIGWFIYVGMIKPHYNPIKTTTQNAERITNINITESDDAFFLGVKLLGFKIGVSRPVKAKQPVIKQEVKND